MRSRGLSRVGVLMAMTAYTTKDFIIKTNAGGAETRRRKVPPDGDYRSIHNQLPLPVPGEPAPLVQQFPQDVPRRMNRMEKWKHL